MMEMLNGASVETLKALVWIVAAAVTLLFLLGSRVSTPLKIAARVATALTAGTAAFAAANLAVVFYILSRITDPRWSVGRDAAVESPDLSAGPFLQPITDTLNGILDGLTGRINDAIALKNAFLIMPDFIYAAGWASVLLVVLAVANRIISSKIETDQARQVERNTRDLADLRSRLGLPPFQADISKSR